MAPPPSSPASLKILRGQFLKNVLYFHVVF
nr:MAG TPA: hypothetical protein [Caudoviricetes sp.]